MVPTMGNGSHFLARPLGPGYPAQPPLHPAGLTHARAAGPMTTAVVLFGEALLGTMGDDPQRVIRAKVSRRVEHTLGGSNFARVFMRARYRLKATLSAGSSPCALLSRK
jgi:hypothetical protein